MVQQPHPPPPDNDALETIALEATGAAAVASRDVVQRLWSGYGQIVRCHLDGAAQLPSVIVKHVRWPDHDAHPRGWNSDRSHRRKVRSYEVEAAWYGQHAVHCGPACRVPRCHAVRELGDEVFIVLEDLDAAGFDVRRVEVDRSQIEACLGWLAQFHATFLGRAPDGLWTTGTYWHLQTRPDELAALEDGALKAAAPLIDRKLRETRFQTLVHGDAKLANFCFRSDGPVVAAVDFQYVGGGCGIKDVAYFIGSCLDETEGERMEQALLDCYFAQLEVALRRTDRDVDFAALQHDWRTLYPVAWTDFYRFLKGWSPGHWKIHRYSERLAAEVLARL